MTDNIRKLMKRNGQHRAVAPIIATLLMVAIAVVGGVLIYVYTQGFFATTSTTTVSTDVLAVSGYDALTGMTLFNGSNTTWCTSDSTGGKVSGDCIIINVRNVGAGAATIIGIKVNGVGAVQETDGTSPEAGEWNVLGQNAVSPTVNAGAQASIVYKAATSVLTAGQQGTVEIATSGGGSFSQQVTEGQRK